MHGRLSASGSSAKYSRLDAEISTMQRNSSTYCDEPEDTADFRVYVIFISLIPVIGMHAHA